MVTNLSFSESAYDRFVTKELKYDFFKALNLCDTYSESFAVAEGDRSPAP